MATIKASWIENQVISGFDDAAIAAGGASTSGDIDINTAGYDMVSIQFSLTFAAGTPSTAATIELFSSSDSGGSDDTIAFYAMGVTDAAGATKIVTISVGDKAYITAKVTNNDAAARTLNASALYAGRLWST